MPNTTSKPAQMYLKLKSKIKSIIKISYRLSVVITYCTLNGLLKNRNDSAMVTALRAVVTVAASVAPHVRTNVNTNCMPKYPDKLKRNA